MGAFGLSEIEHMHASTHVHKFTELLLDPVGDMRECDFAMTQFGLCNQFQMGTVFEAIPIGGVDMIRPGYTPPPPPPPPNFKYSSSPLTTTCTCSKANPYIRSMTPHHMVYPYMDIGDSPSHPHNPKKVLCN